MDKVILELCDKFGVGVEKLIPQVIQYGQTSSGVALRINLLVVIILTNILIGLFFIKKKADSFSTLESVCDISFIIFGFVLFIFVICAAYTAYEHYMWLSNPRIMAIRYILNSIGGN